MTAKPRKKKRQLNLSPDETERRRQLALRIWHISNNMLWRDKRPFFNFDYKGLWEKFQGLNEDALEAEENKTSLVEFVTENRVLSRAVLSKEVYSLLQKIVREVDNISIARERNKHILLGQDYGILAKLMFYGWLTILRRIHSSRIKSIADMPSDSLRQMFRFQFEDEDMLAKEEEECIREQMIRRRTQQEALRAFLED